MTKNTKNQMRQRAGFTLIEILMAIALITVVILATGSSFQYAVNLNAFAQNKITAANDAEKTMEEVRRIANANGLTGSSSAGDSTYWSSWISSQTFSGLPSEAVSVSFPAGTGTDPLQVLVTVSWAEKKATRNFRLYSLVTQRA